MKGIAKGFCEKITSAQNSKIDSKQLLLARSILESHYQRAYPKLKGRLVAERSECSRSKAEGIKSGKNLIINPAIEQKSTITKLLRWNRNV